MPHPNEPANDSFPDSKLEASEIEGFDPEQDPVSDVFDRVSDGLSTKRGAQALAEAFREQENVLPTVAAALSANDSAVRMTSARTVATIAMDQPDAIRDIVPELATAVEDGEQIVQNYALLALARVAQEQPEAVRPAVPTCGNLLPTESFHVRARVVNILSAVASEAPAEVVPFLPELVSVATAIRDETSSSSRVAYSDQSSDQEVPRAVSARMRESRSAERKAETRDALVRETAARGVADVAAAKPRELDAHLSTVFDSIARDSLVSPREALLDALAAVAEQNPEAVATGADRISELLEATEYPGLQRKAAQVLALAAEADAAAVSDAVEERMSVLDEMLGAEEPAVRAAAVGLLSYVAEHRPDTVADVTGDRLLDTIEDDYEPVRAGAVWCLRFLHGEVESVDAILRRVAREDPSEEIRELAAEAVEADLG